MDLPTIAAVMLTVSAVVLFFAAIIWVESFQPLRRLQMTPAERFALLLNGNGPRSASASARAKLEARAEALGESIPARLRLLRDPETGQHWSILHADVGFSSDDVYHPVSPEHAKELVDTVLS